MVGLGEGDEGEWELALERISDTDDAAFGNLWTARNGLLDGTCIQLVLSLKRVLGANDLGG